MWTERWSACQVASQPPTCPASQPGQDKSRGSSYYGGSQGVLKPLYAPQRERQLEATQLTGALQSRKEPSHHLHLHQPACSKGKWGVYRVRWVLQRRVDERRHNFIVWMEGDDFVGPEMCFCSGLVDSSYADSFGFICWSFRISVSEISATTVTQCRWNSSYLPFS